MMKSFRRSIVVLAVAIIIVVVAVVAFITSGNSEAKGPHTEYQCDVKSISLSTKIDIDKEGEDFVKVRGNLFRFITDPLTMYDLEDNKIAYAGDAYHFIAQDSHSINVGDTVTAEMVGLVDFFGESYDIYKQMKNKLLKYHSICSTQKVKCMIWKATLSLTFIQNYSLTILPLEYMRIAS